METPRIKPCPFCGEELEWYDEKHTNRDGYTSRYLYFMHPSNGCILDLIDAPFTIGAGDARLEEGYLGEYPELWNKQLEEAK